MNGNKLYNVDIRLETFTAKVKAKNQTEAKKKALQMLKKKDPTKMIYKTWPDSKRDISIDEI